MHIYIGMHISIDSYCAHLAMYTYRIASHVDRFLKRMLRQVSRSKPPIAQWKAVASAQCRAVEASVFSYFPSTFCLYRNYLQIERLTSVTPDYAFLIQ